jgi:dTDP-4-dehydrorhamnose reductase
MSLAGLRGLYHVVGPEPMTKFQFGRAIASMFGLDESLISEASVEGAGLAASRSHNLSLSTNKLSTDLGRALPEFSTGLEKLYTQFVNGYPQRIHAFARAGNGAGLT